MRASVKVIATFVTLGILEGIIQAQSSIVIALYRKGSINTSGLVESINTRTIQVEGRRGMR